MQAKKFLVSSMKEGLKQVREHLGEEALIISHKTTPKGIEIIAGLAHEPALVLSGNAKVLLQAQNRTKGDAFLDAYKKEQVDTMVVDAPPAKQKRNESYRIENLYSQDDVMQKVYQELDNIKQILSTQVSDLCWKEFGLTNAFQGKVAHHLIEHGCSRSMAIKAAQQVVSQGTLAQGYHTAVDYLVESLMNSHQPMDWTKRYYAFVGPSGCGKSKAISKIIPTLLETFAHHEIGLVAYNENRLGQFDEMMIYGHIFQIQAQAVSDLLALDSALNRFMDKKVVLVDVSTQGRNDLNQTLMHFSQLPFFFNLIGVMPSNLEASVQDQWLSLFKQNQIQHLLMTKGDETLKKGISLSLLLEHGLSLNQWFHSPNLEPCDLSITKQTLLQYYRGIYEGEA